MKIVTVEEMRELEQRAEAAGISTAMLMERAGRAVAQSIRDYLGGAAERRVLVLVGPGNNGGDGLVAARHLADWGARVRIHLVAERSADDPNYRAARQRAIRVHQAGSDDFLSALSQNLQWAELVLDAILGTGRSRPLEGDVKAVLDQTRQGAAQRPGLRIVALDVPSGLNADTGDADPACLPAHHTITLGFPKHGLFRFPGASYAGSLEIVDIGIPPGPEKNVPAELMTAATIRALLPQRPSQSNKGTFGRVLVVAGSGNYIGAAQLACRGALRTGAGLVTMAAPRTLIQSVAGSLVEATYTSLTETETGAIAQRAAQELEPLLPRHDVLLVGCGLGEHPETQAFIEDLLLGRLPLPPNVVLDADALNILAEIPSWWTRWHGRAVLTPHPGEMARLAKKTTAEVQQDRIAVARAASAHWGQVVTLKGAFTVVASPPGTVRVSPFANPALASAGTGDVLAGATAGLMAQGLAAEDAAAAGVFLHGMAGERFVREHGDTGLIASDLLPLLPDVIREVKSL